MPIMALAGKRSRSLWKQVAGATLTITLMSALVVVGTALFGSEVFAAWKIPENAELAGSSSEAFLGLFNFEAPAETVARFGPKSEKGEGATKSANNASSVLKNWKYTAADPALEALLAKNVALDFWLYLNNNSFGIQEFLEANSPLNYIAASGALYVGGVFLESLLPNLASTNLGLARFVEAYVNGLRSLQGAINSQIPPNFQPPPIPPVSPSY